MLILQELCPDASNTAIQGALVTANGNANAAAQQLLDPITVILDDEQELDDSDEELPTYTHTVDLEGLADVSTPASALRHFQQDIIEEGGPSQRFTVCRLDGLCDLRKDIMGIYKNPNTNLRVKPKVRFEEEDGVGSGPIREFLSNVIKVVDDGIPSGNKPLIFLEGEKDHRLPIHDQSLRLIGTFKAIGRMIGHSILHGGPGLTGLSPAAIHYLTTEREGQQPPPLAIEDIADIELRQLITELDALQNEEPPSSALKEGIVPYLLEAGLDPDHLNSNAKLIVDGLMLFNVIEKRRLELEDVAKGMEEVSLHSYMIKWPSLVKIVFPTEASRVIQGEDVKKCIVFEEKDSSAENQRTADFFVAYVGELELRKKDGAEMIDLISFWTGGTTIPSNHASMRIKFDGGANEMPLSETCFRNIILPTRHATYGIFRAKMDTALKYGSKGFSFN